MLAGEGKGEKKGTRLGRNGKGEDETPIRRWRELAILRGTLTGRKAPRTVWEPRKTEKTDGKYTER